MGGNGLEPSTRFSKDWIARVGEHRRRREEVLGVGGRHRLREVEALRVLAAERPQAAALLVALLVGLGDARAESAARGDGRLADAAVKSPRAVAACAHYKRAKRHLRRTRRSFAAQPARTHARARRAKLRRTHRVRTARRAALANALRTR